MTHNIENNPESQAHLEENFSKFSGDCLTVLKLLYSGKKLTARQLEKDYDLDGRRLRDVYAARPDIIRRSWVLDASGKRTKWKEYWIEIITPTKAQAIEIGQQILDAMNKEIKQGELF